MKRLEPSDSEDDQLESQKKKRRRIKKPQPDSSDDEGEDLWFIKFHMHKEL